MMKFEPEKIQKIEKAAENLKKHGFRNTLIATVIIFVSSFIWSKLPFEPGDAIYPIWYFIWIISVPICSIGIMATIVAWSWENEEKKMSQKEDQDEF